MQLGRPDAVYALPIEEQAEALAWGLVRRRAPPGVGIHPASAHDLIKVQNAITAASSGKGATPVGDMAAHRLLGGP